MIEGADLRDDLVMLALDLARDDDPERIIPTVLETVRARLGLLATTIWMFDEDKGTLELRYGTSGINDWAIGWELPVETVGTMSEGLLSQRLFLTERFDEWCRKEPAVVQSLRAIYTDRGEVPPADEALLAANVPSSLMGVPLWANGSLLGLLALLDTPNTTLLSYDTEQLLRLGELVGISLARALAFERFAHEAFGDDELGPYGSDLSRLLERQRAVIAANARSEEYVRKHLAEDLHDASNQLTAAIRLKLETLHLILGPSAGDDALACVNRIEELVGMVSDENRRLIEVLQPRRLVNDGLSIALESWGRQYGDTVAFSSKGRDKRLDPEVELGMYRIACEAVLNAVHHAQATTIELVLDWGENRLVLSVRDDGIGFDVLGTERASDRLGLVNMRGRAFAIGADLFIESSPGKGTTVTARLPVSAGRNLQA